LEKEYKLSERKLDNLLDEVDKLIKRLNVTDSQFFYNITNYFDDDYDSFTWKLEDY
jgi:hypothetical protein